MVAREPWQLRGSLAREAPRRRQPGVSLALEKSSGDLVQAVPEYSSQKSNRAADLTFNCLVLLALCSRFGWIYPTLL
jgi:hypothetical protein